MSDSGDAISPEDDRGPCATREEKIAEAEKARSFALALAEKALSLWRSRGQERPIETEYKDRGIDR